MQQIEIISALLVKHFQKTLTPEEAAFLENWINRSKKNRQLFEEMSIVPEIMAPVQANDEIREVDVAEAWRKLKAMGWKHQQPVVVKKMNWSKVAVAAMIAGIVFVGVHLWQMSNGQQVPPIKGWTKRAMPYTQPARLTLDNGETIDLDGGKNGVLATQGDTRVTIKDGALQYKRIRSNIHQVIYNKVTVPWGNDVVSIQLSDGSKVWLNGGSSIRYPVVFNDGEREVEVTGEAYFEVTSPAGSLGQSNWFVVSNGSLRVTMRGARFNVNMNGGSGARVTLLEGSVKMKYINAEQTVKAGQQAVVDYKTIALLHDVDVHSELAWKKD